MTLEIIATESLGVRGMCCLVTTGERRILIDPGLALGYLRHGFPLQCTKLIKYTNHCPALNNSHIT